jgi:hypothetical protein
VVGSRRIFEFDSNALTYINAVETADGQELEFGVKTAINNFVVGCKADGIWTAIKASCILAGARTLSGALTPLVGAAPSGILITSGNYDRVMGIVGNGGDRRITTSRNNNSDPQNNNHNAVFITVPFSTSGVSYAEYITSADASSTGANAFLTFESLLYVRSRRSASTLVGSITPSGLLGHSRSASASFTRRVNTTNLTVSATSETPNSTQIAVGRYTRTRYGFYSVGEALDLARLETRVSGLMNAISGAIA